MSIKTADVLVYVDSDGKIVFSVPGDVNLGGDNITNVTELTEVTNIINTTTDITITPGDTFDAKIGEAVTAVRDFWASSLIETLENIKTQAFEIIADHPEIQGLINEVMSIKPVSSTYDVVVGAAGTILSNFLGYGDLEAATDNIIGQDFNIDGILDGTSGDLYMYAETDAYDIHTGHPTTYPNMSLISGNNIIADDAIDAGGNLKTGSGLLESTTTNLTLQPDTDAYDILAGTGSFQVNVVLSDDLTDGDVVECYWLQITDGPGGTKTTDFYEVGTQVRWYSSNRSLHLWTALSGGDILLQADDNVDLNPGGQIVMYGDTRPNATNSHKVGTDTDYFSSMDAYAFYDHGGGFNDYDYNDLEVVRGRKPKMDENGSFFRDAKGRMILDLDTIPEKFVGGKKEGLPKRYWSQRIGEMTGVNSGAIIQVDDKVEELKNILLDVQQRLVALEGGN